MIQQETEQELWKTLNHCIDQIINCEAWGFDLTACYAMVSKTLSKLRKCNPIYDEREFQWKSDRAFRIGAIVKGKMKELKQ